MTYQPAFVISNLMQPPRILNLWNLPVVDLQTTAKKPTSRQPWLIKYPWLTAHWTVWLCLIICSPAVPELCSLRWEKQAFSTPARHAATCTCCLALAVVRTIGNRLMAYCTSQGLKGSLRTALNLKIAKKKRPWAWCWGSWNWTKKKRLNP